MGSADFTQSRGEGNRERMWKIVLSGAQPGILAYAEEVPVGWCTLAPRDQFPRLDRSRILAPVDDLPVWSVPCFFVRRTWRRKGVSLGLLGAAVDFARAAGALALEGYPLVRVARAPAAADCTGAESIFLRRGFVEVARRSPNRPILRRRFEIPSEGDPIPAPD
jgi:GNAT superfamily N-acetyltransferase